ncbi:MAG: phosphoenolpyruvate--protein phosphotransferase [Chloroherpetonaceae bacterium]|nr:phosphoenolpyruvate--protein phosphotransferase [Chloroherpetonaceae bacterium]MDW8437308.1 phosphoenolpyruvate--protein phosphotransferase [Chloroherpetonaceae bacterium]
MNAYTHYDLPEPEVAFQALGAAKGIAIGKAYLFQRDKLVVEEGELTDAQIEAELIRLETAIDRSEKELNKIATITEQKVGAVYSQIFTAQIMILRDDALLSVVRKRIAQERKHASVVVSEELSKHQQALLASNDALFRERVDDIQDLKERIIRNLQSGQLVSRIAENSIVVASMLTPADVILFSRQNILGCATEGGGLTSHAALICQSLDIPMVIGLRQITERVQTGQTLIVDGYAGVVILNPTPETISTYERKQKRSTVSATTIEKLATTETRTKCGKRIHVHSNIDFKEEIGGVAKYGSEGVGLYRSENLFLATGKQPSEAEQCDYYLHLAEAIAPKPLVIRLFDIGGDKLLLSSYKEANPNLGWRGARILIDVPEILETQVRAILRANVHGNVKMMIPMIASVEEVQAIQKSVAKVKAELKKQKAIQNDEIEIGAMIEVPSAVVMAEEIARIVDFVSIGTNDLIQYALAVDRNNDIVQNLYNKFHPAIVRMVASVIRAAKKHKRDVSMCGEMASDKLAIPLLLGLGLESFSVVSASVPTFKKIVGCVSLDDARELAKVCLSLSTAAEIEQELRRFKC